MACAQLMRPTHPRCFHAGSPPFSTNTSSKPKAWSVNHPLGAEKIPNWSYTTTDDLAVIEAHHTNIRRSARGKISHKREQNNIKNHIANAMQKCSFLQRTGMDAESGNFLSKPLWCWKIVAAAVGTTNTTADELVIGTKNHSSVRSCATSCEQ